MQFTFTFAWEDKADKAYGSISPFRDGEKSEGKSRTNCSLLLIHVAYNSPIPIYQNSNLAPRLRGIKQKGSHRG